MLDLESKPEATERLASIIDRHQVRLWGFLRWLGCSHEEADDLTQETFLAILRGPFVEQSPAATWGYLRTAAARKFAALRKRAGKTVDPQLVESVVAAESVEDRGSHELDQLVTCVDQLPERARQVVQWYYRDRLSWQQIGQRVDRRPNAVKTMLQRLRVQLRDCVERELRRIS